MHFIDSILSNSEINVEPRKFEDIHKKYLNYDLNELKNEPVITENYLPAVKEIRDENVGDIDSTISGEFYQFDEITTKRLVENCRYHKATVQGVLSVATMIALLNTHKYDISKPIKCINAVPCNMRLFIKPKLSNEDCVCGSAALIWPQDLIENDDLWSLAIEATKNIHELRNSNYGMKWWIKLNNMIQMQPYSIMSSSIGVFEMNEKSLKNVTINDVRIIGGTYNLPKNAAGNMTHVVTILNRLTAVMSFTYPGLCKEWAKQFAKIQSNVLEYYANYNTNSSDIPKTLKQILDQFS